MAEAGNEQARRETVAAVARRHCRRLRWRHVGAVWIGVAAMVVGGLPLVANLSERGAGAELASWLGILAGLCLGGAMLVAAAASRFRPGLALRRLPGVLVLGALVGVGLLVADLLGRTLGGLGYAIAFGLLLAALLGLRWGLAESGLACDDSHAGPANLAVALVDRAEAARVLGEEVGDPVVRGRRLLRARAMCLYRATNGRAHLAVVAGNVPSPRHWRGLPAEWEPIAGLGERAFRGPNGVVAHGGGWMVSLSAAGAGGGVDAEALTELVRSALGRLPPRDAITEDPGDAAILAGGLRGMAGILSAVLQGSGRRR